MKQSMLVLFCTSALVSCSGGGDGGTPGGGESAPLALPSALTLGAGTNHAGIPATTARFTFVSNDDASTSLYTVNASSGELRANGYISPGTGNGNAPGQMIVHPSGQFAYVPNIGENTVAMYAMASNGSLTALPSSPVPAGNGPAAAAMTPTGNFYYVANAFDNTLSGYAVNAGTGVLTTIGPAVPTGNLPVAIIIDPSGTYLYVANAVDDTLSAYRITPGTGALTALLGATIATGMTPVAVRIDPKGRVLLVANYHAGTVTSFAINPGTGALTGRVTIPVGANPADITTDLTGHFFYVANDGSNSVSAFVVSPTGDLNVIPGSPLVTDGQPIAVAVDPSGHFLYVATEDTNAVTGYGIDLATGALTRISMVHTRATPVFITMSGGTSAVTYAPTYAYVANEGSNNISAYAVDPVSGAFSELTGSPFASDSGPHSITVERTGHFVYTANVGYASAPTLTGWPHVSGFRTDPATGALTPLLTVVQPYLTLVGIPTVIATDVSGRNVFLATNSTQSVVTYSIDPTSGTLIDRSGNAGCGSSLYASTSALAVDPVGRGGYRINLEPNSVCVQTIIYPVPGALSARGGPDIPTGNGPSSVATDPTGRYVYVANKTDSTITAYRGKPFQGTMTLVGTVACGTSPSSVVVEPSARFLYATNEGSNTVSAFRLDDATGALTALGSLPTGSAPRFVTVDPTGQFIYVANGGSNNLSLYRVNSSTGLLTLLGTVGAGVNPSSIAIGAKIQ